jgi:2-keto-4-pentenoate hydratase/2-oxohepta-3-ene-1,7-dioic acid hydratase in catechol pathway
MKFMRFAKDGRVGLAAAAKGEEFHGFFLADIPEFGDLSDALLAGEEAVASLGARLLQGKPVDFATCDQLPPLSSPAKIVCIGLNYRDHTSEAGLVQPDYPTIFSRFSSSLIGNRQPIVRPKVSQKLDYEGEIVIVIGKGGRAIPKASALTHVFGYSLFNDATLRDYQMRTPQWTMGKNFDGTGSFGPYIVTADELPDGVKGLKLQTLLNGQVVQEGNTKDMVFDVATLIETVSEVMTLAPGDLIVSGTPSGIGMARTPPLWMKPGDTCVVTSEGLGSLVNPIVDE